MYFDKFIEVLGMPNNIDKLKEYLNLVTDDYSSIDIYCENHHILPVAEFPEFIKVSENLVRLPYNIHKMAHKVLSQAYNIHSFIWAVVMMNPTNSSAREKYRKEHSLYMKNLYKSKPEIRRKQAETWKSNWDEKMKDKELYSKFCVNRAEQWTDKNRQNQSERMVDRWQDEDYKQDQIEKLKERYKDPEYKQTHLESSIRANRNPEKTKDASAKIKAKWQDPEFIEKMSKRKPKPARQVLITHLDGSTTQEGMNNMIKKYNLNPTLVYKFINTGKAVDFDNAIKKGHKVTEKTRNTIGLILRDKNETN